MIADRLRAIRDTIRDAQRRAGRADDDVTIVAVTKHCGPEVVEEVAAAGLRDVGENRVQEALAKAPRVRAPVRWHLIGHLQRNKVRRAAGLFGTIHSVDSERLIEALSGLAAPPELFLQVNVSGEATKTGVAPEEVRTLWQAALRHPGLRVRGLMTMAPLSDDPEDARPWFRALRELRDALNATGDGPALRDLSMGMSGDYPVAVEEGATHLRIGTALVGENAQKAR